MVALAGYKPVIEYCGGTEIGGGFLGGTLVQPQAPSHFSTPTIGCRLALLDDQEVLYDSLQGEVAYAIGSLYQPIPTWMRTRWHQYTCSTTSCKTQPYVHLCLSGLICCMVYPHCKTTLPCRMPGIRVCPHTCFTVPFCAEAGQGQDTVSRGQKKAVSGELALVPPLLGSSQRLLNRSHYEVYYEVTSHVITRSCTCCQHS